MRSGAANTERSDDDLEEERGKHQRDPKVFTHQQHVIISTILGRISCALGPYRSPDISSAI